MNKSPKLPDDLKRSVSTALKEDIGHGDLTASLIDHGSLAYAKVIVRERAILCGSAWFDESFRQIDEAVRITWNYDDGDQLESQSAVCEIFGKAHALLSAERTALNFLQTLSGTASTARRFADAVSQYKVRILDTRKTLPGLRNAQKYAVRVGGGCNHRFGLYDGVLFKENHQFISKSLKPMINQITAQHSEDILIEVEIERLDQLEDAIASGANRIMLDNFSIEQTVKAVQLNQGRVELEASGNIDLSNIHSWAQTGVDCISIGALTKHVQAIDFSMIFDKR